MCSGYCRMHERDRAGKLLVEYGRKRRLSYRSGRREVANLDVLRPYFLSRNGNKTKRRVKTPLSKKVLNTIISPNLKYKSWNRH